MMRRLRESACYWSWCSLFVVAPIAMVATLLTLIGAPDILRLSVTTLLFITLYYVPGEHVYRWWRKRVFDLER